MVERIDAFPELEYKYANNRPDYNSTGNQTWKSI